jgi:hydrocephalus-inducing protein
VHVQVSLSQDPPVLAANSTMALEVRFRPLLVGSSDAVLRLDSPELGLHEWRLKLTGAPTNPGRSLAFSVPLGTRDTQVRRPACLLAPQQSALPVKCADDPLHLLPVRQNLRV